MTTKPAPKPKPTQIIAPASPNAPVTYRLPLVNRIVTSFLVSLAFLFPATIVAYLLTHNEFMMFVVLAAFHLVVFVVFFRIWSLISLTISPSGVEYRSPVHRIRSSWDNIEGIDKVGGWTKPVQGLRLRQPVRPFPFLAVLLIAPRRDHDRSIPLEIFAIRQWTESKLGQDIRRHAPRLMGPEPTP